MYPPYIDLSAWAKRRFGYFDHHGRFVEIAGGTWPANINPQWVGGDRDLTLIYAAVYGGSPPTDHQLRAYFESITSSDAYGFKRSRKGHYVNPTKSKEWRWFCAGVAFARLQAQTPALQPIPTPPPTVWSGLASRERERAAWEPRKDLPGFRYELPTDSDLEAQGLTRWPGGDLPTFSDSRVEVLLRNGKRCQSFAGDWSWRHVGPQAGWDIVAYRFVPLTEPPTKENPA